MRKLFVFFLAFPSFLLYGQSNDAALNARLASYMDANKQLDFKLLMNFIHPKLFKVASRETLIKTFEQAYNNDQMKIKMDSLAIDAVGPSFTYGTSAYRKVDYSMTMDLAFTDKEKLIDSAFVDLMEVNLAKAFHGTAAYEAERQSFHLRGTQFMMAIKDKAQPWMFIGHRPDKKLNEFLFPQAVIQKFDLLKE